MAGYGIKVGEGTKSWAERHVLELRSKGWVGTIRRIKTKKFHTPLYAVYARKNKHFPESRRSYAIS